MNKLIDDKQIGPQKLIKKVNQQVGYNQWNQGPKLDRPSSNIKGSQQKRIETDGQYSDDAYDEPVENEDDGMDEVERIRQAMAKEKLKAQKFAEKKIERKLEPA